MKEKNKKTQESGQSLVELSLSLILLLTLLAGLTDFGRAFFTYITLRDAAQEGATYASIVNADPLETSSDVTAYCQGIVDRVKVTTSNMSGGNSSGPVDLKTLANDGEVSIQTWINISGVDTPCASVSAADICMGRPVKVKLTYDSFDLTTPLLGTILGSQTLTLDAQVVDYILTPACQ